MDKNPTSTFKSGGISNSAVVIGVFFESWFFSKPLWVISSFFFNFGFFCSKSIWVISKSWILWFKLARSPVRRPTMDGALESARRTHSCQYTSAEVGNFFLPTFLPTFFFLFWAHFLKCRQMPTFSGGYFFEVPKNSDLFFPTSYYLTCPLHLTFPRILVLIPSFAHWLTSLNGTGSVQIGSVSTVAYFVFNVGILFD